MLNRNNSYSLKKYFYFHRKGLSISKKSVSTQRKKIMKNVLNHPQPKEKCCQVSNFRSIHFLHLRFR